MFPHPMVQLLNYFIDLAVLASLPDVKGIRKKKEIGRTSVTERLDGCQGDTCQVSPCDPNLKRTIIEPKSDAANRRNANKSNNPGNNGKANFAKKKHENRRQPSDPKNRVVENAEETQKYLKQHFTNGEIGKCVGAISDCTKNSFENRRLIFTAKKHMLKEILGELLNGRINPAQALEMLREQDPE